MSIVEELGARVRAAADELPVQLVGQAVQRLTRAADRLRWVRQESAEPMGVPELSAAIEHLEAAGRTLFTAQEQLVSYLAAIGLARDGAPAPAGRPRPERPGERDREPERPGDRPDHRDDQRDRPGAPGTTDRSRPARAATGDGGPRAVHRWWPARIAELTGSATPAAGDPDRRVTDPGELLRRVCAGVRSGDRARVHRELSQADADVGLGLAAIAPPMLRGLATDLLGHPPRAQDLPRLRGEVAGGLRELLPGVPAATLDTLLTRVCRMPPPPRPANPPNPADSAAAAGVVTGLLLRRLGRDVHESHQISRETHG